MSRRKTFFVDFFVLLLSVCAVARICARDVLQKCHQECQTRMTQDSSLEDECNGACEVQRCYDGCSLWTEAVKSSCQSVCNSTASTQRYSILCVHGCTIATSVYVDGLKEKLGKPAAPHLLNKTHNSVTIQWDSSNFTNISYLVQWKYETKRLNSNWEFYDPDNILKTNIVQIEGLRPFTNYKFRVAWILLPRSNVYLSKESISIPTLSFGKPPLPPKITSLAAVGANSISVSWEPPIFINGPIVAYVLKLEEENSDFETLKEIFPIKEKLHFMFTDLRAATMYNLSIRARNSEGEGPTFTSQTSTGTDKKGESDSPSKMVLAMTHSVYIRDFFILFNDHELVFETENSSITIKGVALHNKMKILFVSDSLGRIHKLIIEGQEKDRGVLNLATDHPTLLSVDWLNDYLYIVEGTKISRCTLNGESYEIVVSNISHVPSDMQVDPYNGYLYWSMKGFPLSSLYRVDLDKVKKASVFFIEADIVRKTEDLLSFDIDNEKMRLIIPSNANNTVYSYALDGSDRSDIRNDTSKIREFLSVKSVAYNPFNSTLCWANDTAAFGEEYHQIERKYYHNNFLYDIHDTPCHSVKVYHKSAKPDPVPHNPVEDVQAVFKEDMGKIYWKKPTLLGGLGQGAWQKWSYEVNLIDIMEDRPLIIHRDRIHSTQYTMDNLLPNKTYIVRVRAYSIGGKGPWSANFTGKTVRNTTRGRTGFPHIIWSAENGVLQSDLLGEEVDHLIHSERLLDEHVTDMTWYRDTLFLNTNASYIYAYNTSSYEGPTKMNNISHVASIAVDWLAPKLYRASPIHQLISRCNLDGSHSEHLPIQTIARELAVDSPQGRLYWATSHSVECSKLNGDNIHKYFQTGLFSGKHVMGLTLDFDSEKVYWMVRSHEGAFLYSANKDCDDCVDLNQSIKIIGTLPENDVKGPLWYFSDHLYWLHERREAMVSDMRGENIATLQGLGLSGLRSLMVMDPSLQPQPKGAMGYINVVPERIRKNQISLEGTWDNFTIHWQPSINVNYGTVYYEVVIYQIVQAKTSKEIISRVTMQPSYHFNSYLNPATTIYLSIRPFTYWASAKTTVVNTTTPEDIPSEPKHLRTFVSYKYHSLTNTKLTEIEFRWSPPETTNGIIRGYRVYCWVDNVTLTNLCGSQWIDDDQNSYTYMDNKNHSSYYFKVQARTAKGEGRYSQVAVARISEENPVPKLLLARPESVSLADMDTPREILISNTVSPPVAVTFLNEGETDIIYWLEEKAIMSSRLRGLNSFVVHSLSGFGKGIAVDWVARNLYWSERNEPFSTISVMDLNRKDVKVLLNSINTIGSLEVDPFSSVIIYNSIDKNGKGHLLTCDIKGGNSRSFFRQPLSYYASRKRRSNARRLRNKTNCNCPLKPVVGNAMTIDRSNPRKTEVLWVDEELGQVWASDMNGCVCRLVFNATGIPPTSITADKSNVYWSNETHGHIFAMNKIDRQVDTYSHFDGKMRGAAASQTRSPYYNDKPAWGIRGIKAMGAYLQPYPDKACLIPLNYNHPPYVVSRTPSSVTISLREAKRPKNCFPISFSTVTYTVYYGKVWENGTRECNERLDKCKIERSTNTTMVLKNLEPFTNYTVQTAVSNFYTSGKPSPELGIVETYQTKEGAPSAPVGVSAIPISPTRIDVFWEPPIVPNGRNISYEVRWHPKNKDTGQENAHFSMETEFIEGRHVKSLTTQIEPSTEYIIWVRAFSLAKDLYSDSSNVSATTFDLPNNVTLLNVTPRTLKLKWQSPLEKTITKHKLGYSEVGTQIWNHLPSSSTREGQTYLFELTNLIPKASYEVQLQLTYHTSNVTYNWPTNDKPKFNFQTLGDLPDVPDAPEVINLTKDLYQVWWEEVNKNGGEDLIYELQFLPVAAAETSQMLRYEPEYIERDNSSIVNATLAAYASSTLFSTITPQKPDWQTVYNGSQNQWIIKDLPSQAQYEFRVRAITEYGPSNFSEVGADFFLPEPGAYTEPAVEQTEVILIAVLSASALVVISLFVALYILQKRRVIFKKAIQANGHIIHGPDVELATLRELPHHGNFIHQNNALYSVGDIPTDEELATIPHISREQIGLTKFLGSGAFGEVFEGTAHDLEDEGMPPIKVAVKTLRKGATEQEKAEFLKEAKLMSNFQHEHILKLLGICLNNNPNFIILELMEGGDLLSYLRSNRPVANNHCSLTLDDLLGICVDVAKGCKYLEEMHFVHRDLAARNCLVSSHNPAARIVKIGDFGLARDIYKNDYYRKEGEGLLPVRWMAPESLVDGVFTSQSDIWAFGVLLWEVMTLGQQPYPARTNLDVLHHVRGGGRLDKPGNCPEDLHELMLKCWNYYAENRPTFTYCLETLEDLKHKNSAQNTPLIPHSYIGRYYDGFDNLAYHSEELQQPQSQEELAKIRDSLADQRPLLSDRPADTESLASSPGVQEVARANESRVRRGSSLTRSLNASESSSFTSPLLRNGATSSGQEPSGSAAKYLELLADNDFSTDTDGYEVPLPVLPAVALERLRRIENSPSSEYAQMNQFLTKNATTPTSRRLKLPPTCLTAGTSNIPPKQNGVSPEKAKTSPSTTDNYLIRGKKSHVNPSENGRVALSPMVTSALLKPSPDSSNNNLAEDADSSNSLETTNPFYQNNFSQSVQGLQCTPSVHRCGTLDNSVSANGSPFTQHKNSDSWSLSSASTSTCQGTDSKRHSGISTLSALSNGVDLSYTPKSSWC